MNSRSSNQFNNNYQNDDSRKEGEIRVDYVPPKKDREKDTNQNPKRTIKID